MDHTEFWQHWAFNLPVFKYLVVDILTRSFQKNRVDHWQLVFVEHGALAVTYFTGKHVIPAGHAALLPPTQPYRMEPAPGNTSTRIQFLGFDVFPVVSTRNPLPDLAPGRPVSMGRRGILQTALARLAALRGPKNDPVDAWSRVRARQFLDSALHAYITAAFRQGATLTRVTPPVWLLKTSETILQNAHRPAFDMRAQIAGSGYSRGHFYRLFREHFGITPDTYACQARMRLALKFLTGEPKMSIGKVASACGYVTQGHFNRHFKQHFGVTPTECRQGRRQANRHPRPRSRPPTQPSPPGSR